MNDVGKIPRRVERKCPTRFHDMKISVHTM